MFQLLAGLAALLCATHVAAQAQELRPGDVLRASLNTGDKLLYTLDTESGDFVRGAVEQVSVDVVVRILRPDGSELRSLDGPGRGPESFQFETDRDGAYQIEVSPFEDEAGECIIRLMLLEPVATDPAELADQLLSAYDGDASPGVVVSVFQGGRTIFARAYGMASLTHAVPFTVDTRTNIGSTSKQFTAFAIMLLVERGEVSLGDDVRLHIPELPDLGETVTVRHILSHTSGYREFLDFLAMSGRRMDHGDFIDRGELIAIVQAQPALQNVPGEKFNYNNTAFGLAAVIVERVSGLSFPRFMQENVFGPIGMTQTLVRPSPEHIVPGRSVGYGPSEDGSFIELRDLAGALGAGGIYTTVGDLQKWVENFSSARVGSARIFEQMMTSNVLNDGTESGYGLGLFIGDQRGLTRVHHGGADTAHRSQFSYYPEIHAGITTQSNHAGFDGSIANRLAEAFFGHEMEPLEDRGDTVEDEYDPASFDPAAFDEFVGRYALDSSPEFILAFTREGATLYTQGTGQAQIEIIPTSQSSFALVGVEAAVSFHRNDEGAVEALTLHQGGDHRATRVVDVNETDEVDAPASLSDYVGRYFSQELEAFCTLALKDGELVYFQRRLEDATLRSVEGDEFRRERYGMSFERDRNGQVVGFYLGSTRTYDVRFARVN
jgi:CubicO group peptidase (beta-lactamase class C family)